MSRSLRANAYRWARMKAPNVKTVRLLDLPGFRAFEDKLVKYHPDFLFDSDIFDDLSYQTFGITYDQTTYREFMDQKSLSADQRRDEDRLRAIWESAFESANVDDLQRLTILDRVGFDFRNDYRKPLLCTKYFCRQAEATRRPINNIKAHMPKVIEANIGRTLEEEARLFRQRRRAI